MAEQTEMLLHVDQLTQFTVEMMNPAQQAISEDVMISQKHGKNTWHHKPFSGLAIRFGEKEELLGWKKRNVLESFWGTCKMTICKE